MEEYEYTKITIELIPEELVKEYNLKAITHNNNFFIGIRKAVYGLPQAGHIAHGQLVKNLKTYGYSPCKFTSRLWRHETRDIVFCLVVDDFGVKYIQKEDAAHLIKSLYDLYTCTDNWKCQLFCGVTLKWDYQGRTVNLSLPGYIEKALIRFNHMPPVKPEYSPHAWVKPSYNKGPQYVALPDSSPKLSVEGKVRIQQILGTLLFYERAVDPTILVAINDLSLQQNNRTV
eukprot:11520824-Ditylum_brightwellii.AAC.1